jgi:hypothetical protein
LIIAAFYGYVRAAERPSDGKSGVYAQYGPKGDKDRDGSIDHLSKVDVPRI